MSDFGPTVLLVVALGLAAAIFARLARAPGNTAAAVVLGAPPALSLALGQYAVNPDRQWLLLQPGD